jgi:multicomponent K+:H+ antiporter subunit G
MTPPPWVDAVTAVLVVLGGLAALLGAFGVLRLGSFFQRLHAPTLGATLGTWCFALATALQVSFVRGQPYLHAVLIAVFLALTAPITTVFLARAAVFRERLLGTDGVPSLPGDEPAEPPG